MQEVKELEEGVRFEAQSCIPHMDTKLGRHLYQRKAQESLGKERVQARDGNVVTEEWCKVVCRSFRFGLARLA